MILLAADMEVSSIEILKGLGLIALSMFIGSLLIGAVMHIGLGRIAHAIETFHDEWDGEDEI